MNEEFDEKLYERVKGLERYFVNIINDNIISEHEESISKILDLGVEQSELCKKVEGSLSFVRQSIVDVINSTENEFKKIGNRIKKIQLKIKKFEDKEL